LRVRDDHPKVIVQHSWWKLECISCLHLSHRAEESVQLPCLLGIL
jgi:hypothetical protein